MGFAFTCPKCGERYSTVSLEELGEQIRCRQCGAGLKIPQPTPKKRRPKSTTRVRSNTRASPGGAAAKQAGKKSSSGWTLRRMNIVLLILICLFGWMQMAAEYRDSQEPPQAQQLDPDHGAHVTRGARGLHFMWVIMVGFAMYVWNGVTKLAEFPYVLAYCFRDELWIPFTMALAQIAVMTLTLGLKRLEKRLAADTRRQVRNYPELR